MSTIRAVIFDFNGVLVDDEHLHFDMFREVLSQEGVEITARDYHERFLGLDDRGCFAAALSEFGKLVDDHQLDELIARKARRYREAASRGLKFFSGAGACLDRLAERHKLAINSGALEPEIEFALGLLGRRDRIHVIISAEQTTRCKPDPEGYTLALEGLRSKAEGLAGLAPAECLVIEDSLAGIESAKAAGMWAVGVANTYPTAELFHAGADEVIGGLDGLTPDWLAEKFKASPSLID